MEKSNTLHPFSNKSLFNKIILGSLLLALVLGVGTGYALASKSPAGASPSQQAPNLSSQAAQAPQNDTQTFRDFAEGTIQPKPSSDTDYSEGAYLLERDSGTPVALTSSVVDL